MKKYIISEIERIGIELLKHSRILYYSCTNNSAKFEAKKLSPDQVQVKKRCLFQVSEFCLFKP